MSLKKTNLKALPPLSLYIHIPWCVRKCPYCDFNSHELNPDADESKYVEALIKDLETALPQIWGRKIGSIFFGGGTPSLFSPEALDEILIQTRARLFVDPFAEITLEANPGTVEAGKFREFKNAGINRLSLGIQSFNDRHLESLGRIHNGRDAQKAVEMARHNFDNINLDLMYGLPDQSLSEAEADFKQALSFEPRHISAYHLTIEPNTWFHKHPPDIPEEDAAADMQEAIEGLLAAAGFEHYETSAFGKTKCRHNLNYWEFGDYLGIGAGAHSKISFPDRIVRQSRKKRPQEYMDKVFAGEGFFEEQPIDFESVPFEFMMNAMRLNSGFPLSLFEERTGLSRVFVLKKLDEAQNRGLVFRDHSEVAPTDRGRRFLNDLLQFFW